MERNTPTTEAVRAWLKESGRDRHWLAEQIGFNKRSIDNWFTAGEFPEPAAKHIARLMSADVPNLVELSLPEWERIYDAAKQAGYSDVREFIRDCIRERLSDS